MYLFTNLNHFQDGQVFTTFFWGRVVFPVYTSFQNLNRRVEGNGPITL